ncbi:hypothetical protein A5667_03665 [Mycolicibacterium fortuitum]|nr:hypothetical protein A5667_03665 [Mycolicibacterium fortuitum]
MIMTSCSDNSAHTLDIGFSSLLPCTCHPLNAVAFHLPDVGLARRLTPMQSTQMRRYGVHQRISMTC